MIDENDEKFLPIVQQIQPTGSAPFFLLYLRIFVQQVVLIHALETRKFSLLPI
jgi:hypothetical protein